MNSTSSTPQQYMMVSPVPTRPWVWVTPPPVVLSSRDLVLSGANALFFSVGGLANILVVVVIIACSRTRSVTNVFVLNLAIADLLLLVWIPLTIVIKNAGGIWAWSHVMCKLYFVGMVTAQFTSVSFLTVLSIDRYMAVVQPVRSRSIRKFSTAIAVSAVCWTISLLLVIPVMLYASLRDYRVPAGPSQHPSPSPDQPIDPLCAIKETVDLFYRVHYCAMLPVDDTENTSWNRNTFTMYSFLLTYLLPLCLIWTLYSQVLLALYRKRANELRMNRRPNQGAYRKVTVMVLAVVVAYTVCWFPYWLLQLTIEYADAEFLYIPNVQLVLQVASQVAYSLQYFNSALNPILYAIVSNTFRNTLTEFLNFAKGQKTNQPLLLKPEVSVGPVTSSASRWTIRDLTDEVQGHVMEPLHPRTLKAQPNELTSLTVPLSRKAVLTNTDL